MASNKIRKFRDIVEAEHALNGGLIGGAIANGIRGLVGKTITFKAPGPAGSVTFDPPSSPPDGDPTILRLSDIKSQVEGVIPTLRVLAINGKIAFIKASPTAGVTIASYANGGYAVARGTVDVNTLAFGPGGDLDTLVLKLKHNGGADLDVTFAAPVNRQDVLDQINGVTSPDIVASFDSSGRLLLTSQDVGDTESVRVVAVASNAYTVLGLTVATYTGPANAANSVLGFSSEEDTVGLIYAAPPSAVAPCWTFMAPSMDNSYVIFTTE